MKHLVLGCDQVGDWRLWEESELLGSSMCVDLPSELGADFPS